MNSPRLAPSMRPPLETTEILPQDGHDDLFDQALEPGSELGDYSIERLLGGGGGGIVYAAVHRDSGLRVAIKVLRAEMAVFPQMVTRFVREAGTWEAVLWSEGGEELGRAEFEVVGS